MRDEDGARRLRNWAAGLSAQDGAITGMYWEQAAAHAEDPAAGAWDRVRPDGSCHMPWVSVHTTPCPGQPWSPDPDRWSGSLYCQYKHFHARRSLGREEIKPTYRAA